MRLTYSEAIAIALDPASARPLELIEAARVLRNALHSVQDEMRGRSAFQRLPKIVEGDLVKGAV